MAQLTPITQGRSAPQPIPMNYDIVSFARSVMVSDAQKRFADASFPPELRLQVMKAGVPYNTICKLSLHESMKTIENLRNEAHSLLLSHPCEHWYQLDPWADEETFNIIKITAEQAFLETAMFKLCIDALLPTLKHGDWMSGLSSIPESIGSRIYHLELSTLVPGYYDRDDQKCPLDVVWCRKTMSCMDVLKRQFTNLKACVLTIDLYFNSGFESKVQPFDQKVPHWTSRISCRDFGRLETSFAAEVSNMFDAFIAKGPGKAKFTRIRFFPGTVKDDENIIGPVYYGLLINVDCEKMAAEHEKDSFGTQLFKDAYRLMRTRTVQRST